MGTAIGVSLGLTAYLGRQPVPIAQSVFSGVTGGVLLGTIAAWAVALFRRELRDSALTSINARIASLRDEIRAEERSQDPAGFLAYSVTQQLSEYTAQTRSQTRSSYALASLTFFLSFVLIAGGAMAALAGKSVGVATVAAAAGALSQLLSSLVMRLHTRSLGEMGRYHERLASSQWIGVALGIVNRLPPNEQVVALQYMLRQLPSASPLRPGSSHWDDREGDPTRATAGAIRNDIEAPSPGS